MIIIYRLKTFLNPRIDVNENNIINVDASIDSKIIEELEKHFKIVKSQNLVFPNYTHALSGVLRNSVD